MINDAIRKQHQQIRKALQELQEDVYNEAAVAKNPLWIALRIGNLTGILNMHLKYEDENLYPWMRQHENAEVRELSDRFMTEMGNLSAVFDSYKDKYLRKPDSLKQNPAEFVKDTNQILYAISKRVEKEEHELFPILEQ